MTAPAVPDCPFLAALRILLAEPPIRDRPAAERAAARLDRLEYNARWQGGREGTLAAIMGTRFLLGLATPLPRRISWAARVASAREP